jgi:putative ABC transport system permease protein
MNSFTQDLRYGLRSLLKTPGFTLVAVLTLALGVGANAAIFSVLEAVVLRDLPYQDPDRLAVLWTRNIQQNLPDGSSFLNFRDWKAQSREFENMAAYVRPEFTRGTLAGGSEPERIYVGLVGDGFFQLLATPPLIGRWFEAADFVERPRVVMISHSLWQRRYAADRAILGRTILVNDQSAEVVGVMPPEFQLPNSDIELWQPLFFGASELDERTRDSDGLVVIGRMRASATLQSARAEMDMISGRLREQYPATNAALGVYTDSLLERVVGTTTNRALWLLSASVGLVLLIACANVASLVLARAAARRHEFSLRTSLGAGRMRLVRQALTEHLVLAVLAGTVGLLFAWSGTAVLRTAAAGALPRADTIQLDAGVLGFLLVATIVSGMLAGLLPALHLSSARPVEVLAEGGSRSAGGRRRRRIHQLLVVGEIALAVLLLAGAGLLIRSFIRVQSIDRGFDSQRVLLLQVDLPRSYDTPVKRAAFFTNAIERLRALPGVAAVGAVSDFFIHRQPDYRIALEGQPPRRPDDPAPPLTEDQVVPGYFEAMRIRLVRGRLLQESDLAQGAPQVVVINEEMAQRFWPGEDPVGKRFKHGLDPGPDTPWKTVVGVVADMRRQRLDEPVIPCMFQPGIVSQMDIAVRAIADPAALREPIRTALRALDPGVPPYGIVTAEQRLGRTVALRRLQTVLIAALAAVALILAVIGVYGVIHQSVSARTKEIGIRMALGANAPTLLRMVLGAGLTPAIAGLMLGLLASLALSRAMSFFLYQTSALDPLIYAAVPVLLLTVTTVACLIPAQRAARLDPMAALRRQ